MVNFSKIIFITLIIGVFMAGLVQLGSENKENSLLDEGTTEYLSSINSSIQNIENIEVKETNLSTGSEDSFAKQYLEAKAYSESAASIVKVFGDTPNIAIATTGIDTSKAGWLIAYVFIAVAVILFIVFFKTLFGSGRVDG